MAALTAHRKDKFMANLSSMKTRGNRTSMRNDAAMVEKSQRPTNKDPEEVTPGPQYEPPTKSNAIKMRLPDSLAKGSSASGETVHHLASGHHVKNSDGSTSFHMHALDGEPVSADNMEPSEEGGEGAGATPGGGMETEGDPYGVATALRGMSA